MEYGWGLDSPCPISGFRVTMYDYQAMCRPPTHHHSASQPLVSVSVPPGLPSTRWWPVPFSPGTRAHLGPLPLPPLTHSSLPPRSYLTGQGGSGQLLQQRDSCSGLLAWLRGTLGSSLRSPAEGEGHEGFPPPHEKDLESPSSTRLEALVPCRDSRARTRSPSPRAWRPDFPGAAREAP